MSKYIVKGLLIAIIVLAFFLRVYKISSIPPALSWDEVAIGYNAYSILKTGYDEHHRFMPLDTFISYGDYKPPVAFYVTVPFVWAFGLTEFAVRFPSAVFGTLTVLLTYVLVIELFHCELRMTGWKTKEQLSKVFPLLSAFLLAISPWHINISRAGFEANIALFFVVSGILLLLKSLISPRLWIVAWVPFIVAMYTFNSSRYFVPLFGIGFVLLFCRVILKQWKWFVAGLVLALVLLIPLVPHLVSKEARLRFIEVNIFSDSSVVQTANRRMAQDGNNLSAKIFDNRRLAYARLYALHFLDHFTPAFLFIRGDGNPKFSIQDVGQMYMFEFVFLGIGILSLIKREPKVSVFLMYWLIMAIVPAATARETPHALRILNSLPVWQIFVAWGIYITGCWLTKRKFSRVVFPFFCVFVIILYSFSVSYYLHNYYRHFSKEFSAEWQYGYREAIEYVRSVEKEYTSVIITESIGRPYMYTLFYTAYDPVKFWATKKDTFDAAGFYHVYGFDKYVFTKDIPADPPAGTVVVSGAKMDGPVTLLKTIYLLNGEPVLYIYGKK